MRINDYTVIDKNPFDPVFRFHFALSQILMPRLFSHSPAFINIKYAGKLFFKLNLVINN
jgi:hypothetical protein